MGMAAILVMWPGRFKPVFVASALGGFTWHLVAIGPEAFEMFEIIIQWEPWAKGQTMSFTCFTHKYSWTHFPIFDLAVQTAADNYHRWRTAMFWRRINVDSTPRRWIGVHSVLIRRRLPAGSASLVKKYIWPHICIFFSLIICFFFLLFFFSVKQMSHSICCTMILYVEIVGRGLFNVVITCVQSRCVYTIKYV